MREDPVAGRVERFIVALMAVSAGIYFFLHAHLLLRILRDWVRHPLLTTATHPRVAALDEGLPGYAPIGFWMVAAAALAGVRVGRTQAGGPGAMPWVCGLLAFSAALILPFQALGYVGLVVADARITPLSLWLASFALVGVVFATTRNGMARRGGPPTQAPPARFLLLSLLIALGGIGLCTVDSLIVGPRHFDALWYHVPIMLEWYQDRPLAPPSWWSAENLTVEGLTHWYPANAHCLGFVALCLPAGARLVALMQFPLLALAAASVFGTARLLGHTRDNAMLAPLTLLCIPLIVDQATQPLVDIGVAAFVAAAVYALVLLFVCGAQHRSAALLMLGTAGGLAVGTKLNAVPIIAILLLLALGCLATDRAFRARALFWPTVALAGGGAFWFVRNYALLGYWNPYEVALRRVAEFPRIYSSLGDLFMKTWSEMAFTPWSGLGPVYLTLVPAGLFCAAVLPTTREVRVLRVVLGALLLSMAPWWYGSWRTLHYIIYAITVSCIVAPYALSPLSARLATAVRGLLVVAVLAAQLLNCDAVVYLDNQPSVYPWFQPSRAFVACLDGLPAGRCLLFSDPRVADESGERVVDNLTFFVAGSRFEHTTMLLDAAQLARLQFALYHDRRAEFAETIRQMGVTVLVLRVLPDQNLQFFSDCGFHLTCRFDYPLFSDVVFSTAAGRR